jgi:hypothetical protein
VGVWHRWNHRRLRSEGASLMPAARSFSELTKDFGPERRERIEQRKEQLRQDMTLAELRKAFSLTQARWPRTSTSSRPRSPRSRTGPTC